ncbi:cyclopropane fatty acyl phospholipid synthase [Marinomonas posidonica]|uniref:Cyclopropane-fatty-acyl-phospholipid synthase n=1 Tax=Marinomonas posidonica (strain CECT 7376 / NCIMB 14433 / IVIA-Po-181) TaxID=491952 RepID=F6CUD6_MARPP|nr:cyclopropane fatty acyl phospholipid synthase [Marinomonas posidonica]AEF55255.1 Cyclopropane-fatty-acyl-phospholipid synthase [Marinomonas posidonica IVIA-Po-181]
MSTANPLNEENALSSESINEPPQTAKTFIAKHHDHSSLDTWFTNLLSKADITVNGPNPWDPQLHNPNLWSRVLKQGSLGLGEAYMDGWWDCQQIDEFIRRIINAELDKIITGRWTLIRHWLKATLFNRQSVKRAYQVGEQHYDVGNDLYQAMLDESMAYSCGYWKEADTLHQAQLNKLRLICEKAQLNKAESVVEIGCGWGSFAEIAAREYEVNVTGVTISKEQEKLAKERCKGLPVDIKLMDYRSLEGQYDKAVSIGMFEHVGPKNYGTYMQTAHNLIKEDGIFVLHTIGSDKSATGTDPWIDKYIFPNGVIPTLTQISESAEPYFVIEDVHNFGQDYATTLLAWHSNFEKAWPQLQNQYSERFYRMWTYYLKVCAAAFQSRSLQLYQVVLRKRLTPLERYHSPR